MQDQRVLLPRRLGGFFGTHLDLHRKWTVFHLDSVDMLDLTRPSQRLGADLTKSQILDFAGFFELGHLSHSLLDRDL